jgi:hypothetical protein
LIFQIDLVDPDRIGGSVSGDDWTAVLVGDRAVFDAKANPTALAGRYTMFIDGTNAVSTLPGGDGYATVVVAKNGQLQLAASLADGTKITQSAQVTKAGEWPLYAAPYLGKGIVLGWIAFTNTPTDDLNGDVIWIKEATTPTDFYGSGFSLQTTAAGSLYLPPAKGANVLSLTSATLSLFGGSLAGGSTNQLTIGAKNVVSSPIGNSLTLTFAPLTGTITGRTTNTTSTAWIPFNGVVLQKRESGYGYFLKGTQSGTVLLQP